MRGRACRFALSLAALVLCGFGLIAPMAHGGDAVEPADLTVPQFHELVAAGKIDQVRAALKDCPDLLETPLPSDDEEKRLTPLHTAVEAGQLEMVRLLLQQGVPVDEQCVAVTPLFRAARHGRDEIVKLLLKNGADVNGGVDTTDLGNITPIRAAQLYGHRDTAQLLLEKGAKIDFFSAAGLGWKTFVADCLEENPGLAGFPDKWNFPAIWLAVNTGQAAVVDQLLNAGGTVDGRYGRQGFSALHVAAERGYQDLAICLIKHGMDVNARAHDGKTPLDYALRDGQTEMVQWLRAHGAVE